MKKNNDYNTRKTNYKNAVSYKLHNKRITVVDGGNCFHLDFRIVDGENGTRVTSETIHSIMNVTHMTISKESAKYLASALIDMINREEDSH